MNLSTPLEGPTSGLAAVVQVELDGVCTAEDVLAALVHATGATGPARTGWDRGQTSALDDLSQPETSQHQRYSE